MAEPENQTLRLRRELRNDIKALDRKVDAVDSKINALDAKVDRNHEEVKERIDSLRKVIASRSVLGRCEISEFDHRLTPAELWVLGLESEL